MKKLLMALSIAALGLAYSGTAQAFLMNATGSINVSTTIVAACTVATTSLSFGNFTNRVSTQATSTITVNCSSSTPYRIDIDAGLNDPLPTAGSRRMKAVTGTSTVSYELYKDSTYVNEWGDNATTFKTGAAPAITGLSGTGTGADQIQTVYGVLFPNVFATLGAYNDTLTVTVNY